MSDSENDEIEEEEGPNEYDYGDNFLVHDDEDTQSTQEEEEHSEVGPQDLTAEEMAIYRNSQQQRSRRTRRAVERYQDPDYSRLMSDNGRDIVEDSDDSVHSDDDEDEYHPEVGNDFSMDEEDPEGSDEDENY